MLIFRVRIVKLHARIAHREDPNELLLQEKSDLGLHCIPRPFWQATGIQNFRTCTVLSTVNLFKYRFRKTKLWSVKLII